MGRHSGHDGRGLMSERRGLRRLRVVGWRRRWCTSVPVAVAIAIATERFAHFTNSVAGCGRRRKRRRWRARRS